MIADLKPYPAYKDSRVEWLGQIPAHWETRRLKHLALLQNSNVDKKSTAGERPVRLCNYVDVYYHDKITRDVEFMEATASADEISRFQLHGGDVLITKDSESWDDIAISAYVPESMDDVLCGYHLAHVRPDSRRVDGAYLSRAFAAQGLVDQFRVAANGITRYGLSRGAIGDARFPCPSLDEQRSVAAFLDRATTRIDELVAKKRRLIELLQEKRSALITETVTKGLDPKVAMRDSGVQWLGEIPAHWKVRRLKHVASIQTSNVDKKSLNDEEAVRLCNYVDVYYRDYITPDIEFMQATATEEEIHRFHLKRGDTLITKDSESWDDIAIPAYVPEGIGHVLCGYHLAQIRADPRHLEGEYLSRAFTAHPLRDQFRVRANGITRYGLSRQAITDARFPVPPLKEQQQIVGFVRRQTEVSDQLAREIEVVIERLAEYRTALISAAVTGKIDVRGEAA